MRWKLGISQLLVSLALTHEIDIIMFNKGHLQVSILVGFDGKHQLLSEVVLVIQDDVLLFIPLVVLTE